MATPEERRRRRSPTIPGFPECLLWDLPDGATTQGRELMREWQAGRCAACGIVPYALVEDHDHATGLSRGFLCRPCNTAEGTSGKLLWRWWRRGANPADILGVRVMYLNSQGKPVIRGSARDS